MDTVLVRKYLVKGLIGCLVAAAAIAIISILVGSMTDTAWRALATVGTTAIHVLIVLGIISMPPQPQPDTEIGHKRSVANNMLLNTIIFLVIANFFTSILGAWDILSGDTTHKFFLVYVTFFFAALFARPIYEAEIVNAKLHNYAIAAYSILASLTFLSAGNTFEPTLADLGGGFYGRLMSALLVALVTLLFIMAIMHRLFVQNNPELTANVTEQPVGTAHKSSAHPLLVVLLCLLALFILPWLGMFLALVFGFGSHY